MTISLGIVMDPIDSINPKKDSSFAMLLDAQKRGWDIWYMQPTDLFIDEMQCKANIQKLALTDQSPHWFTILEEKTTYLKDLDVILMRKDPPFDMNYIYSTYLLELAEKEGVLVVNKPQSLRDANEKLFTLQFPQCCAETLVSSQTKDLRNFINKQAIAILKPLDGMGGSSIFKVKKGDPNTNVIIELLTDNNSQPIMAQRYLPEISKGDKRILIVDGQVIPYSLARIPGPDDHRGNLAAGGTGLGQALSERDLWIAQQVAPTLKEKGILFAGIDVIGDYLTEINVTSPTCIRELDAQFNLNISAQLVDAIEKRLEP